MRKRSRRRAASATRARQQGLRLGRTPQPRPDDVDAPTPANSPRFRPRRAGRDTNVPPRNREKKSAIHLSDEGDIYTTGHSNLQMRGSKSTLPETKTHEKSEPPKIPLLEIPGPPVRVARSCSQPPRPGTPMGRRLVGNGEMARRHATPWLRQWLRQRQQRGNPFDPDTPTKASTAKRLDT